MINRIGKAPRLYIIYMETHATKKSNLLPRMVNTKRERERERPTDRHIGRKTDRQTGRERERQRERERVEVSDQIHRVNKDTCSLISM